MIKEIVVGETSGVGLIEVSFSELSTFRRCQKKHNYKYIQNLQRKQKSLPLERGSIIHKCLESLYTTGEWKPVIKEYKKEFNKLFEEEREQYGDLPAEVFRIMRGYVKHWGQDKKWRVMGVEVPFKIRLPKSRVLLKGVIDLIVQDPIGIWAVEHKTHKELPGHDYRMMEVQSTLYYYVISKYFGSDEVMGIIFNYLRTKPPIVPRLLTSGKLSKASIDTDRATYLSAIKKNGLDPEDYRDILNHLKGASGKWFKRERVSRPNTLVDQIVREAILTGHTIEPFRERRMLPSRTIIKQCQWDCEFQPLCYSELHGHDTSFLIAKEYEPRKDREGKEVT